MDFADEHYIKFFTRDTVTWNRWPWQARCVLGPLMRKLTKAGVADVDPRFGVAESVAALITVPSEVVGPALDAYLADGTLELHGSKLVMPKFLEAQESRKTKQVIAHDYRTKQRDVARAKSAGLLNAPVTIRDQTGHGVTSRDPPAQPSPSPAHPQPELLPRAPKPEKPADPRHQPLVKKLCDTYAEIEGTAYPFTPRQAALVTRLLAAKPAAHSPDLWPMILAAAWGRALVASFPDCKTLEAFEKQLARHLASSARDGPNPNTGITERPDAACDICERGSVGVYAAIAVCDFHYGKAQDEAKRVMPARPWEANLAAWAEQQRASAGAAA